MDAETAKSVRPEGFYWVKLNNEWTVSEWTHSDFSAGWVQTLGLQNGLPLDDNFFDQIGPYLTPPSDTSSKVDQP